MRSLFVVLLLFVVAQAATDIEHVHFVQHDTGYLFRSGNVDVLANGSFAYTQLVCPAFTDSQSTRPATILTTENTNNVLTNIKVTQFKETIKSEGKEDLPDKFYLVDFNLLNPDNADDLKDIKAETNWFTLNPTKGQIVQHRILGETTNPFDITNQTELIEKAKTFDSWSVDKLPAFVEQIRSTVTTPSTVPVVALVHCICGCDRTGEVVGSYYMQYMNMSLHDAHELDKQIAGREISKSNYLALYWQCFYLKYGKNFDIVCEP